MNWEKIVRVIGVSAAIVAISEAALTVELALTEVEGTWARLPFMGLAVGVAILGIGIGLFAWNYSENL